MTRKEIDKFLNVHEDIADTIECFSKWYVLSDFVKVDEAYKQYFENKDKSNIREARGYLYDERAKRLRLDIEALETRESQLTLEYMELLEDVLSAKEDINKVFYIVAYHYLTWCRELGYRLTEDKRAPFPFMGSEMTSLAKSNYKKYEKFAESRSDVNLNLIVDLFSEEDVRYYNTIYREFGYHNHATKSSSLIGYLLNTVHKMRMSVNVFEFDCGFTQILDVFVFRYKAMYTVWRLGGHVFPNTKFY